MTVAGIHCTVVSIGVSDLLVGSFLVDVYANRSFTGFRGMASGYVPLQSEYLISGDIHYVGAGRMQTN